MSGARVQNLGRTALSSLAVSKLSIGHGKLGDEDFGVIATLSGSNLNHTFGHLTVPFQ
jgi:hypothetical protein